MSSPDLVCAVAQGDLRTVKGILAGNPSLAAVRDERGVPLILLATCPRRQWPVGIECSVGLVVLGAAALGRAGRRIELVLRERSPARTFGKVGGLLPQQLGVDEPEAVMAAGEGASRGGEGRAAMRCCGGAAARE
jgi:hypothetical protein